MSRRIVTTISERCAVPPSKSFRARVRVLGVVGASELLAKVRFSITRLAIAGVTLMELASGFQVTTKSPVVPPE